MTRCIGWALVLYALLGHGSTFASNTEHLEDYARAFAGDWISEWELDTTLPEVAERGDKVVVRTTTEWILDKNALRTKWEADINGTPAGSGVVIVGWDRSTSEIVSYGFNSFGGRGKTVISKEGNRWVEVGTGVRADGRKSSIVNTTLVSEDNDTRTTQLAGRLGPEGEPLPPFTVVYKRRADRASHHTELWSKYVELACGTWLGTGTVGQDDEAVGMVKGDAFTYRATLTSDAEARACVFDGTFELPDKNRVTRVRGLVGWNPATRQIHFTAYWGDGAIEELHLTRCEDDKLYGEFVTTLADGTIQRSGIVLDYSHAGTMQAIFTSGPRKGEVLSSWKRIAD
jgi:hypothetical protein